MSQFITNPMVIALVGMAIGLALGMMRKPTAHNVVIENNHNYIGEQYVEAVKPPPPESNDDLIRRHADDDFSKG